MNKKLNWHLHCNAASCLLLVLVGWRWMKLDLFNAFQDLFTLTMNERFSLDGGYIGE